MLTRMIATIAALALIGLIALVAALPITAQSDGDSSGADAAAPTATATATPTATPTPTPTPTATPTLSPGPTSFNLTPHIGNLRPNGLTHFGDKWYVSGTQGHRVFIFSDNGTYERSFPISGCEPHDIRGLATDGNGNLVAASGFSQSAIGIWPPQPQADPSSPPAFLTMMRLAAPSDGRYTAHGVAHDRESAVWAAVSWPRTGPNRMTKHALLKMNVTTGALLGTYRMNRFVGSLTYENGNLYALSDGAIVMAVASHLKASPATWVNNWEVIKQNTGFSQRALAFRNGVAYGFNETLDKVQAESGAPAIAPASPAALPAVSAPPTGADPSDAAAPAPNPATPSGTAPNPSG